MTTAVEMISILLLSGLRQIAGDSYDFGDAGLLEKIKKERHKYPMSKYWSDIINRLQPYEAGEQPQNQRYLKLNTNENPYPPSENVIKAIKEASSELLRLYPDPDANELREAIAEYYGLEKDNVFVGNGSDEVLALSFITLFKSRRPVVFPDITYSFYPSYCALFDIESICPPLTGEFEIDIDQIPLKSGGIIFPNPNAITGRYMDLGKIERILEENQESVVIIDEAYIDFGGESCVSLLPRYPNLLIVQTLSKSRSLAGLRVGFAMGDRQLIDGLNIVKNSFNSYPLDRIAIKGATEAIRDKAYFEKCCDLIINAREWTAKALELLSFYVVPSKANFLFIKHDSCDGKSLYEDLKMRGILVRHFNKPGIMNFLRVSIGTLDDMNKFVNVVKEIIQDKYGKLK